MSWRRHFQHRVEAAAAGMVLALCRALPPAPASDFGGGLARLIGPRLPVSRIADRNLRLALPDLDRPQRQAVIAGVWDNLGRNAAELPHLGDLPYDSPAGPGWVIEGADILQAQIAQGGPLLFCSAHIGNWEMLPRAAAHFGLPFGFFYRAAGNPLIDALIRDLRLRASGIEMPLFAKGARGARAAIAHVARGGALAMLVDQKMNDGVEATLFGHPAMTAPATATIAIRLRCPIIMAHVERIGPARFKVVVEPPLAVPADTDRQEAQMLLTQRINDRIEAWIRAQPDSWLWLHRRWPKALTPL